MTTATQAAKHAPDTINIGMSIDSLSELLDELGHLVITDLCPNPAKSGECAWFVASSSQSRKGSQQKRPQRLETKLANDSKNRKRVGLALTSISTPRCCRVCGAR
jgi:hypothetical protein